MSKTVVIHQPDYLPYLGYFHRFLHADLWIILDTAQYVSGTSRSWMNRDKIKTSSGEKWITLAIQKTKRGAKINEIMLSKDTHWRSDNLNLLRQHYRKAAFCSEVFPYIEALYGLQCEKMIDMNLHSIDMLMDMLNIKIDRVLASTLNPTGKSNDLLVDLLKKVAATTYLSGVGARDYYDPKPFQEAGIEVVWQKFVHPVYPQLHGDFIPYLSSIDLLFNCGIEKSRKILRGC